MLVCCLVWFDLVYRSRDRAKGEEAGGGEEAHKLQVIDLKIFSAWLSSSRRICVFSRLSYRIVWRMVWCCVRKVGRFQVEFEFSAVRCNDWSELQLSGSQKGSCNMCCLAISPSCFSFCPIQVRKWCSIVCCTFCPAMHNSNSNSKHTAATLLQQQQHRSRFRYPLLSGAL